MKPLLGALFLAASVALLGCSGNCQVGDPTACDPGLVCEPVGTGNDTGCFPPLEVRGKTVELESQQALGQVFVSAVDQTGLAAGQLTTSGDDGAFTLRIPVVRKDSGGEPLTTRIRLRAQAQGFEDFPGPLRASPEIDTAQAVQSNPDQPWILEATEPIGLTSLPSASRNLPHVAGTLGLGFGQQAPLVVAEADGVGVASTVADNFGQFLLINVPPGTYSLRIYGKNATYAPADGLTLAVGSSADGVLIGQTGEALATVKGQVHLPEGAPPTSVVLIPKSTLLPKLGRGQIPPGMRAPASGTAPNVTGDFSIVGIPDGVYAVIPAYETDGLVRDPAQSFSGSDLLELTVTDGSPSPATLPTLEVVTAVELVSPGATETLEVVGTAPKLTWTAYPSAASYSISVFDRAGEEVFQTTAAGGATSVTVSPALPPGIYQWRVTALDAGDAPLSRSEELLGVFQAK